MRPIEYLTLFCTFGSEVNVGQASKDVPLLTYPVALSAGIEARIPSIGVSLSTGVNWAIHDSNKAFYHASPESQSPEGGMNSRFPLYGFFLALSKGVSLSLNLTIAK